MNKWIIVALVVVGLLWWLSRARSGGRGAGRPPAPRGDAPARTAARRAPQPMVSCAHCGVLLPQAEAVEDRAQGRVYCSPQHAVRGPAAP